MFPKQLSPGGVQKVTSGDHLRDIGSGSDISNDRLLARISKCGFGVLERDDGLWAKGPDGFPISNGLPTTNIRDGRM